MLEKVLQRTALGSVDGDRLRVYGQATSVELHETRLVGMISVRLAADGATSVNAAEIVHELKLPHASNKIIDLGERSVLWMGPHQWLVVTTLDLVQRAVTELTAGITARLAPADISIVEVSDLWAIFELVGPHAADVLRKGCALDVHPREFAADDCAWTRLARVRVGLHHVMERDGYRIFVERSYADYLWNWIIDAMLEFHAE